MDNTNFDAIVADIIDNMAKQKDRAIVEAFALQIGQLLKDNGITPYYIKTEYDEIKDNEFIKHYGVVFDRLDCTKHDKEFLEEIEKSKTENAELHCEIQAMQVLPEELPYEPIAVAEMLINATEKYEYNAFVKQITGKEEGLRDIYGISELRQIAEHLLVHCNNNKDKEMGNV